MTINDFREIVATERSLVTSPIFHTSYGHTVAIKVPVQELECGLFEYLESLNDAPAYCQTEYLVDYQVFYITHDRLRRLYKIK